METKLTKEQTIKALKKCVDEKGCKNCPLLGTLNCRTHLFEISKKYIEQENEPAPAGTDTSSKRNELQLNNIAKSKICQEKIENIKESLLTIYEGMTNEEQMAWELGEIFDQLRNVLKVGEQ